MAIRVLVADDTFLVREAVMRLLTDAPDLEPLAAVADSATLLAAIDAREPDVVVTDIRMPPTGEDEGIRVAAALRETHPEIGVVVLSQYAEPGYVLQLLDGGSARRAYLLKERVNHRSQLLDAIRAVHEGESYIDPKIVELLVESRAQIESSPLTELTPRELETLEQIAQGKSNEAIAESLFLTKRAVEKHINAIFMKLRLNDTPNVSSRVMATLMYLSGGNGSRPRGEQ